MAESLPVNGEVTLPVGSLRKNPPALPLFSAALAARHFIALSRLDASDTAHGIVAPASPQFLARHPAAPDDAAQGFLACLFELQEVLRAATGAAAMSLAPQTEWQSVFAGAAMMRAYHDARGDTARNELLADAPVSDVVAEAMDACGYALRVIAMDEATLAAAIGPRTAALLLSQDCSARIKTMMRDAGVLLHGHIRACDGAAANWDMDVISLPVSRSDGAAGAWAVGVSQQLTHFLPLPLVAHGKDSYRVLAEKDLPLSIGRLGADLGNAGALLQAYRCMRVSAAADGSSGCATGAALVPP